MFEREVDMPRVRREVERPEIGHREVLKDLISELRNSRAFGQPMIDELALPKTGALNITVIWDRWETIDEQERLNIILRAYEEAEGKKFVDNIALASGLTVPEAIESQLLPFEVTAALRKSDKVTAEQCRQAMIEQGASLLQNANKPQLRFRTLEEAEVCVERLKEMMPESDGVWLISQEPAMYR